MSSFFGFELPTLILSSVNDNNSNSDKPKTSLSLNGWVHIINSCGYPAWTEEEKQRNRSRGTMAVKHKAASVMDGALACVLSTQQPTPEKAYRKPLLRYSPGCA